MADDWGIPFMQVGWWLFCLCAVVFVGTSLLTPAPTREQLEAIHWQPPMKVIRETKLSGITDPRIISLGLLALMAVLYFWLR